MYTTINEDGILNNYATEPKLYYAEYPNQEQQNLYKIQGAIATLVLALVVLVAFGVS